MSDIQSNYPRTQVALSSEKVDLVEVSDSAGKGIFAVWVLFLCILIDFLGSILFVGDLGRPGIFSYVAIIFVGTLFFYFLYLYRWSKGAHQALCILRGYQPRISSMLVGIECLLSVFLFGIPVWLTFNFLVINSEPSNNTPSRFTLAPAALNFFVPYTLAWMVYIADLFTTSWVFFFGKYLLLGYAVWAGCRAVNIVNRNLQSLAKIVREQTALVVTADPE